MDKIRKYEKDMLEKRQQEITKTFSMPATNKQNIL